jgi:Papain family cysteine protease
MDYWIGMNSWGDWWGDKGYFKILRGKNLCKIASDANYPVLKTDPPKCLSAISVPKFCQIFGDIYNSTGGYLKSFCIDKYIRNYEDSRDDCYKNGMRLYQHDSNDAKQGLLDYANKFWKRFYNVVWYVEGKNDTGCANLNNKNKTFVEGMGECWQEKKSICEFINKNREC